LILYTFYSYKNEKLPAVKSYLDPISSENNDIIESNDSNSYKLSTLEEIDSYDNDIILQTHYSIDEYYDPRCPYHAAASYISVDISYPQIQLQSSGVVAKKINKKLKEMSHQEKIESSTSYKITSEVTYFQNNLLSVVYKGSSMHCEDRHPYTWYSTANFNLKNGKEYKLTDVLNKHTISMLRLKIKEYFRQKYPHERKNMDFNQTDLFDDFTLNDKNITIYFDMYQIGAGYLDVMSASIPFSQLSGNTTKLKNIYTPQFLKATHLLN
jgi:hypothetical protein